jgi:hypothetical protein
MKLSRALNPYVIIAMLLRIAVRGCLMRERRGGGEVARL